MIPQETINNYISILQNRGQAGFYKKIVGEGIIKSLDIPHPDIEILNLSDNFFILYRRSGDYNYFLIGKVLRRSAHTIYRQLLKLKNAEINIRFLNVVK